MSEKRKGRRWQCVGVAFDSATVEGLRRLAAQGARRRSLSSIVREAVADYLDARNQTPPTGSVPVEVSA